MGVSPKRPLGVRPTSSRIARACDTSNKDGAVEGWAQLRGTYRQGALTVTFQGPAIDDVATTPDWSDPPCTPPSGGWTGTAESVVEDYQAYDRAHPGEIANLVLFRPTDSASVLVLAVQHPDDLRPAMPVDPAVVCVVPSRYTAAEIDAATREVEALMPPTGGSGGVYSTGTETADETGQRLMTVEAVMVTERLRSVVLDAPAGLIQLDPWLRAVEVQSP